MEYYAVVKKISKAYVNCHGKVSKTYNVCESCKNGQCIMIYVKTKTITKLIDWYLCGYL